MQFRRVLRRLGDSCRVGDRSVLFGLLRDDHLRCVRGVARGSAREVGRIWVRSRRPGQVLRFSEEITRGKGKCVKLSLGLFLRSSKPGRRAPFIQKPGHLTRPPRPASRLQCDLDRSLILTFGDCSYRKVNGVEKSVRLGQTDRFKDFLNRPKIRDRALRDIV